MDRSLYDTDPERRSEFNSPKTDRCRLGYDPARLEKLEELYKSHPKLTRTEAIKQKVFDISHQVSEQSLLSDFEHESCSEVPFPRPPEFHPSKRAPTSACGIGSTQLSPGSTIIPITFHPDTPKNFSEHLKEKIFYQDISDITSDQGTKIKVFKSAFNNNYNMNPSLKKKETETDHFSPLVNGYLNEQKKNIDEFGRQMGLYMLSKVNNFNDENRGANYEENVLKYGKFRNNNFALPLTEVKRSRDILHLKNKLEENAIRLKCFKEQTLELSAFVQYAASWIDRSHEEIIKQLKVINSPMFKQKPPSTKKTESTNGLMLNSSTEEKLVADSSTMTSPVNSEDDSSSVKKSRSDKEIENNRTFTISENNKKIVKMRNAGTMTEKKKHCGQSGKHKNLNKCSTEASHSNDKKRDVQKETCEENPMTSHSLERNSTLKSNSLNETKVSKNNAAELHSSIKKQQKSKCSSSIATADDLVGKKECQKGKHETKQDTKSSTITSDSRDFETIVDSGLTSLLEDSSTLVGDESSSEELLQFNKNCSPASSTDAVERRSSVNKESGHHGPTEKRFEHFHQEKYFKPPRKRTSSLRRKHFSRKGECDNRSSTSNTSTRSSNTAYARCNEGKKNKEEPTPRQVSKSVDKYGLPTPNVSFQTADYMLRFNLIMPYAKEKISKHKKKK